MWPFTKIACGHILAAVRRGMAECTPNLRASYEAAETTPRSSRCPPTTTALPFKDGSNNSSTETKKASMSTWKMVLTNCSIEEKAKVWIQFYQYKFWIAFASFISFPDLLHQSIG